MTARRQGTTVLEATVALTVLAAVLLGIAQLSSIAVRQQRYLHYRQLAVLELRNQLEEVLQHPVSEISQERLSERPLTPTTRDQLPQAQLAWQVANESDPLPALRVHVELRWTTPDGLSPEPVRLTGWIFPGGPKP